MTEPLRGDGLEEPNPKLCFLGFLNVQCHPSSEGAVGVKPFSLTNDVFFPSPKLRQRFSLATSEMGLLKSVEVLHCSVHICLHFASTFYINDSQISNCILFIDTFCLL